MAKLHKVSMFVLDVNEEYDNIEELIKDAFDSTEASAYFIEAKTSQFPWYDDIILNDIAATKEDYESFMNITEHRKQQMIRVVGNKHEEIKQSIKDVMKNLGLPTSDEDMIEFLKRMNCDIEYRMY